MSNVIDLSTMLGDGPTHRYTLAEKELPYPDPTLEESGRLQRLAGNLTLTNIYKLTREYAILCLGDDLDDDWFNDIALKEAVHFLTYMQNPTGATQSPEVEPVTVKLGKHTLILPPVDMGALGAFGEWLEDNPNAMMDELRAFQLQRLLTEATLEDGSELPPEFATGRIPKPLGEKLVDLYINGVSDETKKALPKPKRTAKGKRATGLN